VNEIESKTVEDGFEYDVTQVQFAGMKSMYLLKQTLEKFCQNGTSYLTRNTLILKNG
jgi:hypothetical protein